MSEITLYEAQAKKMQGICDEHNLTYRFLKDRYPHHLHHPPDSGHGRTDFHARSG